MSSLMETLKAHPVAIGVGGLVVAFILLRGGGSSAASNGAGATLQSQQIAASEDVALASTNADLAKTRAAAAASMYNSAAATSAQIAATNTSALVAGLQYVTQGNIAADQTNAQLQAVKIDSANKMTAAMAALATQWQIAHDNNNTQLSILSGSNAQLPLLLQHAENMATITGATQTGLARIGADAATKISDMQTSAAVNSSYAKDALNLLSGSSGDGSGGGMTGFANIVSAFGNWF